MRQIHAVAALAVALIAGGGSQARSAERAPTPVGAASAVEGPAAPAIRTNGLLASKDEIRLSFKVGGVIRRIGVREGERVRRGQQLAQLEQTEIDAQVEQAHQSFEKAQRDAQRGERLYADSVISLEQFEDLRTQAAVARATLESARFNRRYAVIEAPRDGVVQRRLAQEREVVGAGDPVIVLGAHDRGFVVRASLSDREIVQVQLGDTARIELDALPNTALHGAVSELAGAADPASGMFAVEIAVDAADIPLRSGLIASVTITPSSARAGTRVYVPLSAIVEGDRRTARVFVLDRDVARRRDVQVAFIEGEHVALASGMAVGEQVITDGAHYLEDGELVTLVAPVVNHTREPARRNQTAK